MRVAIDETLKQRRLLRLRDGRDHLANGIVGDCSAIRVRRALGRCPHQIRIDMEEIGGCQPARDPWRYDMKDAVRKSALRRAMERMLGKLRFELAGIRNPMEEGAD